MPALTVGELRAAMDGLPDDAEVHFGVGFDPRDADAITLAPKWCVESLGGGMQVYTDSEEDLAAVAERHGMADEHRSLRVLMIDEEPIWDDEDED